MRKVTKRSFCESDEDWDDERAAVTFQNKLINPSKYFLEHILIKR